MLFGTGVSQLQPLSWMQRMKIALGAAKSLAFIRTSVRKVIHRDFKSANILLDINYNAKLSDFGFAKDLLDGDSSNVATRVMGTCGYVAPEYVATGRLSYKGDVYGFGVVMLELLSGRKVVDVNRPTAEQDLVEWAKPFLANKHKVLSIFDARMKGQYSVDAARKAANLAEKENHNTVPICFPTVPWKFWLERRSKIQITKPVSMKKPDNVKVLVYSYAYGKKNL